MNDEQFRKLVKEMRQCQKDYFRSRAAHDLERAKAREQQVDQALRLTPQIPMFPEKGGAA